jgi:SAM-dependent methyltransferase
MAGPGRRGHLDALGLRLLDGWMHAHLGERKRALFAGLSGTVLEIGAGAGANLRYLPPGTHLVAVEPNAASHRHLLREAARRGVRLEVQAASAEALPLADGSVGAALSTLVLCTVADPERAIAEVRRVLRPGGRFLCVEHVAAPDGTLLAGLQRAVDGPWRRLFAGCSVRRDTEGMLRRAGFRSVEVERLTLRTLAAPVRPVIAAVATR